MRRVPGLIHVLPWIVAAWLAGAVPFGVLLAHARGVDIHRAGSGNIGATNVGRVLGRRWGLLCFALDFLKGFVPVLLAGWALGALGGMGNPGAASAGVLGGWLLVAAATVAGHMASPFLRFRGGKGVATSCGACLALWPVLGVPVIAAVLVWGFAIVRWRMVSLASVIAAAVLPIVAVVWAMIGSRTGWSPGPETAWPAIGVAVLLGTVVIWRHRTNLDRIRLGLEPRIGARRTADTTRST